MGDLGTRESELDTSRSLRRSLPPALPHRDLDVVGHDLVDSGVEARSRELIAAGGVGPTAVVMEDPDSDRFSALGLGVVRTIVVALVGHDPLVALDRPVEPGRVSPGALVATDVSAGRGSERLRGLVAAVVRDQAGGPLESVRSEEHQRAV